MSKATRATVSLHKAGVDFTVHLYDYDPDADRIGLQAAEALGEAPARVLKTLMATVDGRPACVILPSDREVSMKKLAAALGGKSAEMMKPADAERVSGYKVGGISPFGRRKPQPLILDSTALRHGTIAVSGGRRGLQLELAPAVVIDITGGVTADIAED